MSTASIRYILLFLFIAFAVNAQLIVVLGQSNVCVTKSDGIFEEICWVSKADTSIRDGESTTYYKSKALAKGFYRNNERVGRWRFYNLNSILEYEYDFDTSSLIRLSGKSDQELEIQSPCLFKGSPIIPYLFLVNRLGYPQQAINKDIEGRVVLALKVNSKGEVYGFYIAKKLHPVIDHAVFNAAKEIPITWEFIASTIQGVPVNSEYQIAIEFTLE
ncbi:TonB family protein [Carboxylicivirga sp. M1479]|uniref:TonB family protein n=1 Tax=Carboxylicivirga sp. M1479 TaxID=2594476 RepID=UPI00117805A4|nr:TonB family protein [Carboxylicivirga sp. M1479]TRX62809.1 TonB family protein [Carboxylicivirga sp. M1479]